MTQFCRQCGNPLSGNEKFCRKCGAPVLHETEPKRICPSCQKEVRENAAFCPHCGKPVSAKPEEKNQTKRQEKKRIPVWLYFAAAVLLVLGIFLGRGALGQNDSAGSQTDSQTELQFLNITETGDLTAQANQSSINCLEFVIVPEGAQVYADPPELDLSEPGDYNVAFTCEWPDHPEKTVTIEKCVHIYDDTPPLISVKEDQVIIKAGTSYDIKDNIEQAYDNVDGDLTYSKTATDGAYYTIEGSTDFSKAGVNSYIVTAYDAAGNSSSAEFTVKVTSQQRFVAIPTGCSSNRTDYDTLFAEMEIYGKEYTSPAYSTKSEMESALREFEKEKYPNRACQVYPAVHIEDGNESQWIFYDYNPWDD